MRSSRDTVLGIVFFGGIAFLVATTIFLSERVYGRTRDVAIEFEQALGLKTGDPVHVSGVKVGYVREIRFSEPQNSSSGQVRKVLVTAAIREEDQIEIGRDYKVQIEYASVLGGRIVAIEPGFPDQGRVQTGPGAPPLVGSTRKDPLASLGDLIEENRPGVKAAITEFTKTFEAANSGQGTLAMLLNDAKTRDDLKAAVDNVAKVTARLERGEGTLGKLLTDPKIADDIALFVDKLNRGEGVIPALVNNKEWVSRLDSVLKDVKEFAEKINSGDGTISKLVNSSEIHDRFVKLETSVQEFLDKVNRGDGWLVRAFTDKQLGDDVAQAVRDVKEIFATINRGEGTLGRLVKDDTLIRNIDRLVRQLSRSVEDAREAAPIATFSSVLFGSF
ncbi:MAG: MCE family protein [Planctomycetes bacterium]|nr:MCE family protein [Planctomycetota bacterium]